MLGRVHLVGFKLVRLLIAVFAAQLLTPVQAQHYQGHGGSGGPHGGSSWPGGHGGHGGGNGGWHGGPGWRGGHWYRGAHGGRNGWWWVVGPSWYYYPTPIYPDPDRDWPPLATAPPQGYLFYCPSFVAYYPYVTVCPGGWTLVPAAP